MRWGIFFRHFFPKIRVQLLDAIRAEGMAEVHGILAAEIFLDRVPISFVVSDIFTRSAYRKKASEGLNFLEGAAQILDEQDAVALRLDACRYILRNDD